MAKATGKQPDKTTISAVPKLAGPAQGRPWPVGALAGKLPPIEIADIKAARQEALLGEVDA